MSHAEKKRKPRAAPLHERPRHGAARFREVNSAALPDNALDRECAVFCRYLIGQEPNKYVQEKYRAAHQQGSLQNGGECNADAFLVKVAAIGAWSTKIIDAYTRVFRPFSTVRKKLVLLLAILESCAPTHRCLDDVDAGSSPLLFLRFFYRCVIFVLVVMIGVLLVFPAELMLRGNVKRLFLWLPRNG